MSDYSAITTESSGLVDCCPGEGNSTGNASEKSLNADASSVNSHRSSVSDISTISYLPNSIQQRLTQAHASNANQGNTTTTSPLTGTPPRAKVSMKTLDLKRRLGNLTEDFRTEQETLEFD